MRQATSFGEDYLRLAELIRYENVRLAFTDPAIDAADALLALRERILERTGFAVTGMDGKPHTLSAAAGKVALVSFVTTVCARWLDFCERPLPALEDFYQEFGKKGVAVFAITSEDHGLVTDSLQGETYTVPLFLDPGHKVAGVFGVPYRHESFLFDREGKLVARAIGIRTEDQLREMAKKAGME
jgi:peroxiredoxin